MYGRQSLSLAHSLADDARRRAAEERRSAGYRTEKVVTPTPRHGGLRAWIGRALRPATHWPNVAG
jgi:hypothetical protein